MRLFIGIPLAESVQAALSSLIARLRPATNLRWSEPDSWHITLQFLGNTTPEQYLCLIARLAQFRFPPVPIHLGELGVFDRAGIFYAAIAALLSLTFIAAAIRFAKMPDRLHARTLVLVSIIYLPLILTALALDKGFGSGGL